MDRVHSVWTESTFCNTNLTLRSIQWTKHGILLMVGLGSWFFLQNTMSTNSSQYFTDFQCMGWCTTDVCRKFWNNFENFLWKIPLIYCQKRDFSFNVNFYIWFYIGFIFDVNRKCIIGNRALQMLWNRQILERSATHIQQFMMQSIWAIWWCIWFVPTYHSTQSLATTIRLN